MQPRSRAAARHSGGARSHKPAAPRGALTYRPQLALLVRTPPHGDEWLHEIKLDGYRIGTIVSRGRVSLLSRNGRDWTGAFPEIARAGPIRYTEHVEGRGDAFFAEACRQGLEGIVSKRRDMPHSPGRHGGWVKTKCTQRQEFVIAGFTDPEGARAGLGALLVGYHDGTRLAFAGKVGTGFTHKGALDLRARLERIERKECPFNPPPAGRLGRSAHWVKPALVCEVTFTEWTGDDKVRHPSFHGLRADKDPADVRREGPSSSESDSPRQPGRAFVPPARPSPAGTRRRVRN